MAHSSLLRTGEWSGELRQRTKQQRLVTVESRWTLVSDDGDGRRSVLVVNTDVTEKRSVEAQLLHMQRMESIGTLAGGVAHEFNNLLQAIRGYAQFAVAGLSPGEPRFHDLQQVLSASERATNLTRQLLTFGRREALAKRMIDLNQVVAELAKMLRPLIGAQIEVQVSLQAGAGGIYGDPSQLHQAIMNLCLNARDAMPGGGHLLLKTETAVLSEDFCRRNPGYHSGQHVILTVSDSGCGMSPEVSARVFEPFFTTKETGKGTGLGLAMAYSIVQQHEGAIQVSSEAGHGSTFRVYFPVVKGDDECLIDQPLDDRARGGTECVLIAEDDPVVRQMLIRVLAVGGYSVLTAGDGLEALERFERYANEISLVILNSLMPKVGGLEAFARMKAVKPELRAILSSGKGVDPAQAAVWSDQGITFLQKPFSADVFLRIVRNTLDDAAREHEGELIGAAGHG
jgi:signal transduction histidine kinase/CheY-like chemotaxis protein